MTDTSRRAFLRFLRAVGTAGLIAKSTPVLAVSFSPTNRRPLEMLAIGDSVVWGQGLIPNHKFSTIVRKWLEGEKLPNGRRVNLYYEKAHSGASVTYKDDGFIHGPFKGEVNVFYPFVLDQVDSSLAYYNTRKVADGGPISGDAIDLIIVDGGINDMGAMNIVNLFYRKIDLKTAAETHCRKKMVELLLPKLATKYPNARIVVTGYFPLISPQSDVRKFWDMILKLFPGTQILNVFDPEDVARVISKAARVRVSFLEHALAKKYIQNVLAKAPNYAYSAVESLRNNLADRSDHWYEASNTALENAVNTANASLPATGSIKFSGANPRILFAKPIFGPENCFAAPRPFLWELSGFKTNDELYLLRQTDCKVLAGHYGNLITCHRAGLFHPNRDGSDAYAKAIKLKLETILPQTGW